MSNEWIRCDERLPKVNEKIFVGNKQEGCEVTEYGQNFLSSHYFASLHRNGYIWLYPMNGITHWRPIPEKRPDFSKLNNGDLIVVENNICGYVISISKDLDTVTIGYIKSNDYMKHSFHCEYFENKKITRINIEEQTFEEI